MPTIFLDISRLVFRLYRGLLPTGIDRVGLAYIERYGERASAVLSGRGFSVVLTEKDSRHAFSLLSSSIRNRSALRKLVLRACANQLRFQNNEPGILLHTSHNGMEYPRYYGAMAKRNIRPVFMVHDLIPMTHAEYCRPGVDQVHRQRIHTVLQHAHGLIANSVATLDELTSEANRAGLPLPPSVVAHLAPGNAMHVPGGRIIDTPYFVMLGTIEPRKNHWFMLHVWRRLVERLGAKAPKLVIIGRRGWEIENTVDMLERCASLQGSVVEESNCSDERLIAWLHHAEALLAPSFAEGFGMPIVEALAMGVPVIASDLDVFREIAGDIPDFVDPLDGLGWLANIEAYSRLDRHERATQLERIEAFRAPTWQDHFSCVDRFIEALS